MTTSELNTPGYEVPPEAEGAVAITTIDRIYNFGRRSSIWPMMFGLACCAIEMICAQASRYDLARFGMEVMRPSPRQSDLMLVAGTVTKKMIPPLSALQPDAGAQVRRCDGCLRLGRRSIQGRLQRGGRSG